MIDLGEDLDRVSAVFGGSRAGMPEMARQVPEIHGTRLDGDPGRLLDDRTEVSSAIAGQDHAVDALGDLEVPGNPLRRQQGGHRDRQHGDLGRETRPRCQVVQDLSEREFREAARDKQVPGMLRHDRLNPAAVVQPVGCSASTELTGKARTVLAEHPTSLAFFGLTMLYVSHRTFRESGALARDRMWLSLSSGYYHRILPGNGASASGHSSAPREGYGETA